MFGVPSKVGGSRVFYGQVWATQVSEAQSSYKYKMKFSVFPSYSPTMWEGRANQVTLSLSLD